MSCTHKTFFGINLIEDDPDGLSPHWSEEPTAPATLVFGGRRLIWRFVRSRELRGFFGGDRHRFVPVESSLMRQIRLATGCHVGPFQEFQTLVRLLAKSEESAAAVYLLGRTSTELQRIEQNVRATFPGLRVVGRAVFHPSSIASVTTAIRKAAPRIVLSGVTNASFFRWVVAEADRIGPVVTIVAPRGVGRMAGRGRGGILIDLVSLPIRLVLPIPLLIHRIRAIRRAKKDPS